MEPSSKSSGVKIRRGIQVFFTAMRSLFFSFSLFCLSLAMDFGEKAMKCIDSQNFQKASKYLRQARIEDNFVAFSTLAGMLQFDPEDPNLKDLIKSLIAKDETAYLQILSEVPNLAGKIEYLHAKAARETMQRPGAHSPVELLMTYFAEGNHTMFSIVANEVFLDATQGDVQDLVKFIADLGSGRFLDTLAESLINRENFALQVFIADARLEMAERLRKERAAMVGEVVPVVQPAMVHVPVIAPKPDPHPEDCIVHSNIADGVKMWITANPNNINGVKLDGTDNVHISRTSNPNITRFAILDSGYDDVIVPATLFAGFDQWFKDVNALNQNNANGMLAELDVERMTLKLRRIGRNDNSHSIVVVRELKESEAVELPESAAKFYFGEESSTEIKLQDLDLIYFVPSPLLNLPGMRPGIGSFMGIVSLAFAPSDADQRMFDFAGLRKGFAHYVGDIRLFGIFFSK